MRNYRRDGAEKTIGERGLERERERERERLEEQREKG